MSPEVAAVVYLSSLSAVTALAGTRITQLVLPQGSPMPAVRVQLISNTGDGHLRGGSRNGVARIQVDAYAYEASGLDAYADAAALAEAIHGDEAGSGMQAFRGSIGGSPDPKFFVAGIKRVARVPEYEPDEQRLVRIRQDYMMTYEDRSLPAEP